MSTQIHDNEKIDKTIIVAITLNVPVFDRAQFNARLAPRNRV
jgi:hypothetical protein